MEKRKGKTQKAQRKDNLGIKKRTAVTMREKYKEE